jgi:trimeric autotransporter adhesin
MAYGTIKVNNITFDDGGSDQTVTVSGLYNAFTNDIAVTGTISGTTVTGTTANFVSGVFTTQISGTTVTGTTSSFTTGNFTTLSGATATFTSGVIASGTATNPSLSFVSDPNTGIFSPGADQVAVATNGAGRLFVDASGRVGVGNAPTSLLDVSSTSEFTLGFLARTSSTQTSIGNHPIATFANTSTASGNGIGARFNIADTSGTDRVAAQIGAIATAKTASSVTADIYFAPGANERLRITSAGLVGIGSTAPGAQLQVNSPSPSRSYSSSVLDFSNIHLQGSSTAATTSALTFTSSGSGGAAIGFSRGAGLDTEISFWTNSAAGSANTATERMRITSTGNVGIGTTAPATLLHANGTIRYTNRPAAGTITAIGFDANGDLKASSSSLRYKHDIENYGKGLAEVMELRPVSFKFNGEDRTNIGFIAEEVDELGLTEVMLYNEEDQPEGVMYANMISLLTKAIQELKAEVDELKSQLS